MKGIGIDEGGVGECVKEEEMNVGIEKSKGEEVEKGVEGGLKKGGMNGCEVDREEEMERKMGKGW